MLRSSKLHNRVQREDNQQSRYLLAWLGIQTPSMKKQHPRIAQGPAVFHQEQLQKDTSAYFSPYATAFSRTIRSFRSLITGLEPLRFLLTSDQSPNCCSQNSTSEMRVSVLLFLSQLLRRDQIASLIRCP